MKRGYKILAIGLLTLFSSISFPSSSPKQITPNQRELSSSEQLYFQCSEYYHQQEKFLIQQPYNFNKYLQDIQGKVISQQRNNVSDTISRRLEDMKL
jgi:hypothetical protein